MTGVAERLGYLEGLRGIAAFIVYLGHFCPLFIISISFIVSLITSLFFFGRLFCVCIFFVLSGYVLTYTFFRTKKQEFLIAGAVRRYIRLLVPVAFLLLVVSLFIYPGPAGLLNPDVVKNLFSQVFWGVFIQGQYAAIPTDNSYTGVLWTMTIEFIGSFIVFSFASLFGKLHNRWVFYGVAVLLFLNSYYLAFILGMALADLSQYTASENVRKLKNSGTSALALLVGLLLGSYPVIPVISSTYSGMGSVAQLALTTMPFARSSPFQIGSISEIGFIYTIGAFFVLVAVINATWLQTLLSSRIPVFLGKISFSLYLIHMLVINTFSFFLLNRVFGSLDFFSGICIFLITTPVLLGCSYLMYTYVDLPGIGLSKRVYSRFFAKEKMD